MIGSLSVFCGLENTFTMEQFSRLQALMSARDGDTMLCLKAYWDGLYGKVGSIRWIGWRKGWTLKFTATRSWRADAENMETVLQDGAIGALRAAGMKHLKL